MRHALVNSLFALLFTGCAGGLEMSNAGDAETKRAEYGDVVGRVVWEGGVPDVPPIHFQSVMPELFLKGDRPNPNAPIDGLAGAVVFLKRVDPIRARAWDHPPVQIELKDRQLSIHQGCVEGRVGFVRAGDPVTMISREPVIHLLRARGADYFTFAFPDPDRELRRTLKRPGLVELSSATGFYWMRGYLFVAEHPYFCRCDAQGNFHLRDVPLGRHELICWHPNWAVKRFEREPETGNVARVEFEEPFTVRKFIDVVGPENSLTLTIQAGAAAPRQLPAEPGP